MCKKTFSTNLCTLSTASRNIFSAFAVILPLLFHCESYANDLVMTEADNGKRICLETGDTLSLHLEGNPTTGFTWEITSKDDDCLQKAEQSYMSSSTLCGSGGMFSFTFRAASGGTSNLHLVYVRPWEKETLPPKTFEVTVTITSPKRHSTNLMP